MNWKHTVEIIERFIADKVEETGASGAVIGLSGGLDSAVTLKLCLESLRKERIHALIMPEKMEGNPDTEDAIEYAKSLGIQYEIIEIDGIVRKFSDSLGDISIGSISNIKARTRMILLYGYAYDRNLIVMGTSNKSELLTGYFTKFGDGGVDFMPIGDLYKTEVVELARYLGIPEKFIEKRPSAGLYPGQSDEEELGMDYRTLDCILMGFERDMKNGDISEKCGVSLDDVKRIWEMLLRSAHKRKTPLIPKIGLKTVGWDWRE